MKQISLFAFIISIVLATSCTKETEGEITPANFHISATPDGTGVILQWDKPVVEVDGYKIYFEGNLIATLPEDSTIYIDIRNEVGTYTLRSYIGDSLSDPLTKSTLPEETRNITIYELNASGYSGLGFTSSWVATAYPMADPNAPSFVDFYYTDLTEGVDTSEYTIRYIAYGGLAVSSDEGGELGVSYNGNWRQNRIKRGEPVDGIISDSFTSADDRAPVDDNTLYIFKIEREDGFHYGILEIASSDTISCTISTIKIQKIPNLRLIGQ